MTDVWVEVRLALAETLAQGGTLRQFTKRAGSMLEALVPDLGERRLALELLFNLAFRFVAAVNSWAAIERLKDGRPWLRYVAILDDSTRAEHRAWHGTVLRVDDPWWASHAPPNGWRCRCTVQQLSDRDLERFGFTPSSSAPVTVGGIDPGWGCNPGTIGTDPVGKAVSLVRDRLSAGSIAL